MALCLGDGRPVRHAVCACTGVNAKGKKTIGDMDGFDAQADLQVEQEVLVGETLTQRGGESDHAGA